MEIAYSFYFRIRKITELESFKIWKKKEICVNRYKNQLLHPWSETVLFSVKASRQKNVMKIACSFYLSIVRLRNWIPSKSEKGERFA